ncbi:MAG: hypothetical protein JWR80_8099 [Bradyrhizobium sp.]|nr:hypothetical protein [Bradyrhizobium sp.]
MHITDATLAPAAREQRARRLADRYGLRLVKSRRELDRGGFALIDLDTNGAAFGLNTSFGWYEATLDEIEEYLSTDG